MSTKAARTRKPIPRSAGAVLGKSTPPLSAVSTFAQQYGVRIAVWTLAILVAAGFYKAVANNFSWLDDGATVHQNSAFSPPTLGKMLHIWVYNDTRMYVPTAYTAWGLLAFFARRSTPDWQGITLDAQLYHLMNVVAHLITVLIVFIIIYRLWRRPWAAFAGAALFCVHPQQVETVAWVTGLKEGLCGLFGLLSLWLYLIAIGRPPAIAHDGGENDARPGPASSPLLPEAAHVKAPPVRLAIYVLAFLSLVLADFANPLAVMIPFMAFVLDAALVRRDWKKAAKTAAPLLVVTVGGAVIAKMVQGGWGPPTVPVWSRPLIATDTLAFYIYKLFFPLWLCVDYGRRPEIVLMRGWAFWTWILPAVLALAVMKFGKRRRWLWAGACLYVLGFAPVLGLIPFDMQQFTTPSDRYAYLSMFGPAVMVAGYFAARRPFWQRGAWVTVIGLLTFRSSLQCEVWQNDSALWANTIKHAPDSYLAHANLAFFLARLSPKNLPMVTEQFEIAVKMAPDFFNGHMNLSQCLLQEGRIDEAIVQMKETIRLQDTATGLQPIDIAKPNFLLGGILVKQKRAAEAMKYLEHAEKVDPDYPGLNQMLQRARQMLAAPAMTAPTTAPTTTRAAIQPGSSI